MKKALERLRLQKGKAVERMAALDALAKRENRALTPVEQVEYDARKAEAEGLVAAITQAEEELAAAAPPAVPPSGNVPDGPAAVKLERERVAAIDEAAGPFLRHNVIDGAFVETFKRDGNSVDQFKIAVAEKLAARSEENPISGSHETSVVMLTGDARDKMRAGMIEALLHRYNPGAHKIADGNEFRGMSLMRIAEECLTSAGVRVRGMSPLELAQEALSARGPVSVVGQVGIERLGAMGVSDFPYVTANVANKSLRSAYDAEEQTFRAFCRQSTNRDFKAKYINQLGDAPDLEKVGSGGEFQYGQIPEARESLKLETYGKILPFTRQALLNDDMGAFTRLPELQGRAVSRKESDIVWGLIIANPTMGDGKSLFDAAHHNIATAAALGSAGWAAAKALMRKQKGLEDTQRLNLEARFLLACSDLELVALQLTSTAYTPSTQGAINPWAGRVTPVIESRLDDLTNKGQAWLAVADPARIDTIEYAYLEGQPGAYLETQVGFDVDGMKFKVRLDFGAAAVDYRAFVRNAGAAQPS